MRRIILIAASLAIAISAAAQPSGQPLQKGESGRPRMKHRPSVEQEAQMRVDQMSAEMPLTDKQVKKLLKFYKKDIKYRRENFQMAGGPRPEGGQRPDGQSGHGPGMGQGRPQGGPGMGMGPGGGPGGNRGGQGGMRPGNPPGGDQQMGQEIDFEKVEKYNQKQDKKLCKIIGEENFAKWRSAHPHEVPKLPELELK